MPPITLESIEAKQTELGKLIEQFKAEANKPTLFILHEIAFDLQPGERYAGPVLDASGQVTHHLVLMTQRPTDKLNWQAAMDWAQRIGGSLPTRQEHALLYANCKPHLEQVWHWSSETHEDDASFAWGCNFSSSYQYYTHKSNEGSAVAVRRV